ncbi:hypothetical protein SEA_BLUENGOLD_74 [Gordonia phage BlueNGold]|nr:hypothetical protein SEA_BLUENGOLD_74 [Gordonia phage BlueNGold]WBF03857.1 hypothetical protein SEA_MAREELIH_74 [Gordonia phage Mareelih]
MTNRRRRFDTVDEVCLCNHDLKIHRHDGPCGGKDSYGIPCECAFYVRDDSGDEYLA